MKLRWPWMRKSTHEQYKVIEKSIQDSLMRSAKRAKAELALAKKGWPAYVQSLVLLLHAVGVYAEPPMGDRVQVVVQFDRSLLATLTDETRAVVAEAIAEEMRRQVPDAAMRA